ncbi:MAG: uracil-DNA glycosylase [Elusimicrobium sp.]|jgi:DNA polymerase|nr:uracil-DNA glycosylase [Elusimicrobium sp.]
MKKEARDLAREFKTFLANNEEEDFIIKAGAAKAPASLPAPAKEIPAETAAPAMPAPAVSDGAKAKILAETADEILRCQKCPLGATRIKAVPGEGNPDAKLMFIGEGPGFDEDHQGRPFIGRAGQLLTKMIEAMGLNRDDVYIANMVKCHPMIDATDNEKRGNDRAPSPDEIACCRKFIEKQIAVIRPEYIVALGGVAAKSLIRDASLTSLRGKIYDLELDSANLNGDVKIIATYHPAALLRNPNWKKDAWEDLKMLMREMGLSVKKDR